MKILLFGTGEYYNRYKIWFRHETIVALIDNSTVKQGTLIDGLPVYAPEEAVRQEYDAIFIMSFYIVSMRKQLMKLGVEENVIHHFYEIHDFIYDKSLNKEIKYYGPETVKSEDKGILLLNQDLTLGGPALALYQMAKVLVKNGFRVTYGSQIDGPLREILVKDGIPVVVDLNLLVQTMDECEWVNSYSLILCNTINFHVFLSKRDTSIPMIWWLHDAPFFYEGVNKKAIASISRQNLKVWGVGPVSAKAIKTFRPDFHVEDLLYGVEDVAGVNDEKGINDVVRFVTIGYIEERKGQDVLINAIKKLPSEIRKKARFLIVGQNSSMLAQQIMKESEDMAEVVFTGLVDRDRINQILVESDIMICPSREDPMPTVCAEAMMHGVPCIISDAAGTIKYISDQKDGLIFHAEDSENLARKITWIVNNSDRISDMGYNARKVFDRTFEMKTFEKRLLELIRNEGD